MKDDIYMDGTERFSKSSRRRFLSALGVAGVTGLAGCNTSGEAGTGTNGSGEGTATTTDGNPPWYGSGPGAFEERPTPGGTSMDDMPDLSGTLNVYSGRGEALVGDLLGFIESKYPDFEVRTTYDSAASLANRIVTEGQNTPADVFYSVNAGALGFLADEGATESLNEGTYSLVPSEFRASDNSWIGTSGRARTVPYNTNALSADGVPSDIMSFPDHDEFAGKIGWAPTYSSFQGFVTAMRVLEGDADTREWLNGIQNLNVEEYSDEFQVVQAVADGEIQLGFANHYYTLRVLAGRPNAPIDIAFTNGDAGAVFNVAGAAPIAASSKGEMADTFVRHLLSSEAQEYFAVKTFEYPLVDGVDPVGRLPPVSELNVPNIDLSKLSNLDETVTLMREEGVL
ncbi:extracellular solute-binding protein [Haloarculaceae archaeon H-GB2-1]|nr:extracellular solute-binding protein [Haloarculaceae archaeon H-GB1-1]MEA5386597.1 extracellular solute-binding protein [Haloarculaceae archaeon H-GB11]MEA5408115.1 extracellular solute-binding protein [Haloarculaceae archaeon H-GB2-1]